MDGEKWGCLQSGMGRDRRNRHENEWKSTTDGGGELLQVETETSFLVPLEVAEGEDCLQSYLS